MGGCGKEGCGLRGGIVGSYRGEGTGGRCVSGVGITGGE